MQNASYYLAVIKSADKSDKEVLEDEHIAHCQEVQRVVGYPTK